MKKKNTIRLNESQLRNMISESVKKTVNEVSHNGWKSFASAGKKARKYGEDKLDLLFDRLDFHVNWLREEKNKANNLYYFLKELKSNPRISKQYLQKLMSYCEEIEKALDDNGPIGDAVINQLSNSWEQERRRFNDFYDFKKPYYKPRKTRDLWEPSYIPYGEGEEE